MKTNDHENELIYYSPEMIMQLEFYQFPKWLLMMNLNSDSKLLYMILLDRYKLSIKNGWIDKANRVYMIYTRSEAMKMLGIGNKKCSKLFDELKDAGLIEEKRSGAMKPNTLYLKGIDYKRYSQIYENDPTENLMCQNDTSENIMCQKDISRSVEMTRHDVSKGHVNNNDISKNNINNCSNNEQFDSAEDIQSWDFEEFYDHLNDEQYASFMELLSLSKAGVIHSSKESLVNYFKKMMINGWKDSNGNRIQNIVGYVSASFSLYEKKRKESYDQIQYIK